MPLNKISAGARHTDIDGASTTLISVLTASHEGLIYNGSELR